MRLARTSCRLHRSRSTRVHSAAGPHSGPHLTSAADCSQLGMNRLCRRRSPRGSRALRPSISEERSAPLGGGAGCSLPHSPFGRSVAKVGWPARREGTLTAIRSGLLTVASVLTGMGVPATLRPALGAAPVRRPAWRSCRGQRSSSALICWGTPGSMCCYKLGLLPLLRHQMMRHERRGSYSGALLREARGCLTLRCGAADCLMES